MTTSNPAVVNLLSRTRMRQSEISLFPYYDPRYSHHYPYFGYGTIDMMLKDSRIQYGLGLIKGPIYAYTKFFSSEEAEDPAINQAIIDLEYHYSYQVTSKNKDVEEFVIKTLNRFWNVASMKALRAIEWGHSCCQSLYKKGLDGQIQFDDLEVYGTRKAQPVSKGQQLAGIYLKEPNKYIPLPKSFVHVHQREYDRFLGRSRLAGCHIPWHETWHLGGARDIRRNWFYKCAYDGGTAYVPVGSSLDESTGTTRSNTEIAAEIMENGITGSFRIFPKSKNAGKNEREWEFEPAKANTTPDGMMEYNQELRIEILEGMNIPPEVVENSNSNGMGSATGRKVPLLAFYATLSPISIDLITDVQCQIVDPLLKVNGMTPDYEITRIIPKSYDAGMMGQDALTKTETDTGLST